MKVIGTTLLTVGWVLFGLAVSAGFIVWQNADDALALDPGEFVLAVLLAGVMTSGAVLAAVGHALQALAQRHG